MTEIERGAFRDCTNLEEISLPFVGKSKDAVGFQAVLGYIFDYTIINTKHVGVTSKPKNINSEFNINAVLKSKTIPDGTTEQYSYYRKEEKASGTDVYWLGATSYCYYIPQNLKKVTISNCTRVPTASFLNCSLIENLILKGDEISMEQYAIYKCDSLKSLTIDSHKTPNTMSNSISVDKGVVALYAPEEMVAFYSSDERYNAFSNISAILN